MVSAAISVRLDMTRLPLSISTHKLPEEPVDWDGCGSDRDTSDADRKTWLSRECVLSIAILPVFPL